MTKRFKRALLALGLFALVGGGALVATPWLLFHDPTDYSHVSSIERAPEYKDAALLQRAFELPVAGLYQKGGFEYQRNGGFCGPASAVGLAHSLGTPADQSHILNDSGVRTVFGVPFGGLTLDELAQLVEKKLGRKVTVLRDLDLAHFREEMTHANDPSRRYLVNFTRGPLFGRGGGHHSPIGGYLADQDLVLVLDVNARYKPWLVKTERLFEAVDTIDKQSHKKRGLLLIE
jgi:hypothetical protein